MASLKFIMHLDDDQPDSLSSRTGVTRANSASAIHSEASTATTLRASDQEESSHASSSSIRRRTSRATTTRVTSTTTISVPRVRPAPSSQNSRGSRSSSALASVSEQDSPRRQSNASNDSMDHLSHGSAASSSSRGGGRRLRSSEGLTRPLPGPTPAEAPVRFTPITGRVSRARKGQPVHKCELCRPVKTFTRAEHLRRHQLSHQTPGFACSYPGCDRAFHRPDLLHRHLARHEEDDMSAAKKARNDDGESPVRYSGRGDFGTTGTNLPGSETQGSRVPQPLLDSVTSPPNHVHGTTPSSGKTTSSANTPTQPAEKSTTTTGSHQCPSGIGGPDRGESTAYSPALGKEDYTDASRPGSRLDAQYTRAPSLSIISPSSSSTGRPRPSAPSSGFPRLSTRANNPVFATHPLPTLSIPDRDPPGLYHTDPDTSQGVSSASDSTFSTPASASAQHAGLWLGQYRSPTSTDWSTANLLSPYRNPVASRNVQTRSIYILGTMASPPTMFGSALPPTQLTTSSQAPPSFDSMPETSILGFGVTGAESRTIGTETGLGIGGELLSTGPSTYGLTGHRLNRSISMTNNLCLATGGMSGHSSATLVSPMVSLPTRLSQHEATARQKEHFMDITDSYQWGGNFDPLAGLGGGFGGDVSPGGTRSGNGLLAALDLPMTGCNFPINSAPNPQLPRAVQAAIPGYVEIYWQRFHRLYPIVHRSSFQQSNDNVLLQYAMAAVATQYLNTKEDRLKGNQLYEHAWQELRKIAQWDLATMQAILLCEMFARFRGRKAVTKPSKMFQSLYSRVLYSGNSWFDSSILPREQQPQSQVQWHAWLDAEARRRLLTACFILDLQSSAYQQQGRAFDFTTELSSIPLTARSVTLWEASTTAEWWSLVRSDPEAVNPYYMPRPEALTPEGIRALPEFDQAAVLTMELLRLPRLSISPATPSKTTKVNHYAQDMNLDPFTRPSTTPGTRPCIPPTISFPAPGQTARPLQFAANPTPTSPTTALSFSEARIKTLFPTDPIAATHLALHQTPLHDLLAVSGDTWIFSQKVLPATSFLDHQRRLKAWADGRHHLPTSSTTGGKVQQQQQSAAKATIYAAQGILSFLARRRHTDTESDPTGSWQSDLSDYWALYVCALIIWAFGHHRVRINGNGKGQRSSPSSSSQQTGLNDAAAAAASGSSSGATSTGGEEATLAWLRGVSSMGSAEVVRARGRSEAAAVVALVRRQLEVNCVGGRNMLYADAVGVLKKLEEGVNWNWF